MVTHSAAERRPTERPSRLSGWTPGRLLLVVGLAALVIYLVTMAVLPRRYGHIVSGDGIHYYVYLRSLVLDGDLDFRNEYERLNLAITDPTKRVNTAIRTPTGLVLNQFSVGPALLALPLYLVAHGLSLAGRAAGLPVPTDGFGPLYEGSYAVTGLLAGLAGAACAYGALRRLLPVGPALLGVAALWLGGSLLYYGLAAPVYAHAHSAFLVAAWLLAWSRLRPGGAWHWLGLGLLGGLMATMRWQEALFTPLPLAFWLYDQLRGRPERAGSLTLAGATAPVGDGAPAPAWRAQASSPAGGRPSVMASEFGIPILIPLAYGAGLLIGFLPQMAAWQVLFGSPLAVPQTGYFFTWANPHWVDVLISTRNGLFTWTPVALLGTVGLLVLLPIQPRWALVGLVGLLLQVGLNGVLQDWWGGAAFGARRFLGLSVFLALGVGWLIAWLGQGRQRLAIAIVALLIGLNGLLILQYTAFLRGLTHLDEYPTVSQLVLERFTWPIAWLRRGQP